MRIILSMHSFSIVALYDRLSVRLHLVFTDWNVKAIVREAMGKIENHTCIRFKRFETVVTTKIRSAISFDSKGER